jgi:hypothetical protein
VQEGGHKIGTSVYHMNHKSTSVSRGYGAISGLAPYAADGVHRYYVSYWERPIDGAQNKAISAQQLDVPLVHHKPAAGLGQPIMVLVRPHKAATGTTVAKVCPLASLPHMRPQAACLPTATACITAPFLLTSHAER